MRKFFLIALLVIFSFFPNYSYADSGYVLPYPSSMPGSLFYKPRIFLEIVSKYWYFGSIGQFEYNLKESDKYLVEAKTLFEYGQYLHAANISLKKSDEYFARTFPFIQKAKSEGKDIREKRKLLNEASQKHIEILKKLSNELPDKFEWKPEKAKPTLIPIKEDIMRSITIRSKYL